jgi:hypothetical protein
MLPRLENPREAAAGVPQPALEFIDRHLLEQPEHGARVPVRAPSSKGRRAGGGGLSLQGRRSAAANR